MDSLDLPGNKNAHLMREVEESRAARAEAKSAKDMMMAKFKNEYGQTFNKVKEVLKPDASDIGKLKGRRHIAHGGAVTKRGERNLKVTKESVEVERKSIREAKRMDALKKQETRILIQKGFCAHRARCALTSNPEEAIQNPSDMPDPPPLQNQISDVPGQPQQQDEHNS
jgi:hypothetical protein